MADATEIDTIRAEFIEKIGLITQAEGLPRIAGRVFGLMVFDGDMISFGDLADKLQVSRASISTSVRLLEERGLVKRMTKPGERQDFFQLAPNPYATLLEGTQKRTRAARDDIAQTIEDLPAGTDAIARLTAYAGFYGSVETGLGIALDALRQPHHTSTQDATDDR